MKQPNYDKFPAVPVPGSDGHAHAGWPAVADTLLQAARDCSARVIVVDCYPGVLLDDVLTSLTNGLQPDTVVDMRAALKPADEIEALLRPDVCPDDPVFGRMTQRSLTDLFDAAALANLSDQIRQSTGRILVFGTGAALACDGDLLIYADLARWEIQRRQRAHLVDSIGAADRHRAAWDLYKRGFFVDWRLADAHKRSLFSRIDFFLDTNNPALPKLATGDTVRQGLRQCLTRPFRVVPFFDPGVWGGHWMEEKFDLDRNAPNHAWCFDCVPEENSLLLDIGGQRIELPSLNLVHQHPVELLGQDVYDRFGAEFPIRFDLLDTMGGGNLSLQVHPRPDYIREHFAMPYTQDESYYLLDAGDDACVYLGFKESVSPDAFAGALQAAQSDATAPLDVDRFVNRLPARRHDHFLIPAGTIHCSGRNSMVLEISATPYIFTFKLWDWGRLDLNGKPRPISLKHGLANLDYSRTTPWVADQLVNRIEIIARGDGWTEERTGLHASEFIETRRHTFTKPVAHHTGGRVNVLNLVEGDAALVESPTGAFEPFEVHYAGTFIVPATVGDYTLRPATPGQQCMTMKATVRPHVQSASMNPATVRSRKFR